MRSPTLRSPLRLGALAATAAALGSGCTTEKIIGPTNVDSLVVSPATIAIDQLGEQSLDVSALDKEGLLLAGVAIRFTSSDTDFVKVSNLGVVRSVGRAGTGSVTVRGGGAQQVVPVTVRQVSGSISVSPNPIVLLQGASRQLDARVLDAVGTVINGAPLTFASTNESVATVTAQGLVTSVGPAGSASIIVTSDTLSATIPLAVTQVPTRLSATPNPLVIAQGFSGQITCRVLDAVDAPINGAPCTYQSGNTGLVTVSSTGAVTSVGGLGSTTVTVRSSGLSASVTVEVVSVTHPSGEVVATPSLSGAPYTPAISRNNVLFVTQIGGGAVSRANLPNFTLSTVASPGGTVGGVTFNSAGTRAYVVGLASAPVTVFDVSDNSVVATYSEHIHGTLFSAILSADEQTLYIGSGDYVTFALNLSSGAVTELSTGAVTNFARDPTRNVVYASAGGAVYPINTTNNTLGTAITGISGSHGIAVSPDGSQLFVAVEGNGTVEVYDIAPGGRVAQIPTGVGAFGLALTPDGQQLYVAASNVAVIDVGSRSVVKTIAVGGLLRNVAVNASGTIVAIADENGRVVFIQ